MRGWQVSEMKGRVERQGGDWVYSCALFSGRGPTPEAAYLAYLGGFDYKGPELNSTPYSQNVISQSTGDTAFVLE